MSIKKQKAGRFISLRFPEDVGTQNVPAYIRFTPQTVKYGGTEGMNPINKPNLQYGTGLASSGIERGGILDQIRGQIGGVVESFSTAAKSSISALGNIFRGASFNSSVSELSKIVSGSIKIGDFTVSLGQKTKPDTLKTEGSINLYLPDGLITTSSVSYDKFEAGQKLPVIQQMAERGDVSREDIGKLAGAAVGDAIRSAGNINAIQSMVTGKLVNNFSFQLFNGVNHRQFEYAFTLIPKNEKEAKEIKNICDTFLFLMLPARSSQASIHFYEVPCQWKIEYQYLGKNLEFHLQPKACFLQNVIVEYGSNTGNTLHTDGSPLMTKLSLQFVEIEPLYRKGDLLESPQ